MKSSTDLFWDSRPSNTEPEKANINDHIQRKVECSFIESFLDKDFSMLEVGCGNGYLSQWLARKVKHLDAFDYSGNMIKQAQKIHQRGNIDFFEDNVLNFTSPIADKKYDLILCVRVLINLRDLGEQKKALENLSSLLNQNGKIILIEGFLDGFENLCGLREQVGLSRFSPASINYYSKIEQLMPSIESTFKIKESFHTGCFDFLTRVVNPLLNGASNTLDVSSFHEKVLPLCLKYNPDEFRKFARLHGFCLSIK